MPETKSKRTPCRNQRSGPTASRDCRLNRLICRTGGPVHPVGNCSCVVAFRRPIPALGNRQSLPRIAGLSICVFLANHYSCRSATIGSIRLAR